MRDASYDPPPVADKLLKPRLRTTTGRLVYYAWCGHGIEAREGDEYRTDLFYFDDVEDSFFKLGDESLCDDVAVGLRWLPHHPRNDPDALHTKGDPIVDLASAMDDCEPLRWLYLDMIPEGVYSLLAGETGVGKSTLALAVAVQLAETGRTVLYVSNEDPQHIVAARAKALLDSRADRVVLAERIKIKRDMDEKVLEHPSDLVIVDAVTMLHDGDSNSLDDVYRGIDKWRLPLEAQGRALLGIAHLRKNGTGPVSDRIHGSRGFVNRARVVLSLTRRKDGRVFLGKVTGTNYASLEGCVEVFTDEAEVVHKSGETSVVTRSSFGEGWSDRTLEDVLAEDGERLDPLEQTRRWVTSFKPEGATSAELNEYLDSQRISRRGKLATRIRQALSQAGEGQGAEQHRVYRA